MSSKVSIPDDVLRVLAECIVVDCNLFLPPRQLDRKLYLATNKALEILGGKWNRGAKAHVFDHDPTGDLSNAIVTGEVVDWKKEYQFYETPRAIVDRMIEEVGVGPDHVVLEPSAGKGAIARVLRECNPKRLDVVEIYDPCREVLLEQGFNLVGRDFLEFEGQYDRIVMNPPFTGLQDVNHVLHAYECLKVGGYLVSVMSESPFFVGYRKAAEFRDWLYQREFSVIDLERGAFAESGVGVKARIVAIGKGEEVSDE